MRHGQFIELDQTILAALAGESSKDKYHIAAACGVLRLDGTSLKLTRSQQEAIFGGYIFGKSNLRFNSDGQGTLKVWSACAFGLDSNEQTFTFEESATLARENKRWIGGAILPVNKTNRKAG